MGRPIMIDDGGSIRITWKQEKQVGKPAGKMDDLLEVKKNGNQWESEQLISDPAPHSKYFGKALIVRVAVLGDVSVTDRSEFKTLKISTDSGQKIEVTMESGDKPQIKVSSDVAKPIFESKCVNQKRSYAVVDGDRITNVKIIKADGFEEETEINVEDYVYSAVVIV